MLRLMMATKKQIIEKQRLRYQKARKKERTAILTSLALSTELSRDHLARVLRNGYPDRTQGIKGKRGRKPVYGMAHKRLLVWSDTSVLSVLTQAASSLAGCLGRQQRGAKGRV